MFLNASMKLSKLSYLNYCREKDQTCKFQPNHNETICALFVIDILKTSYVIWGNDNDKQLYLVCLLCQCNLHVSLPVDKVVKSL